MLGQRSSRAALLRVVRTAESRISDWTEANESERNGLVRAMATASKCIAVLLCLLVGLTEFPGIVRAAAPAMIVPGQLNVTDTGAFTYTIPIAVPPGTAGMVPALSLDYSSQNNNNGLV